MTLIGDFTHINKVLIANRGEIAVRAIKSLKALGLVSVAIYTTADRGSLHVKLADEVYKLPGSDQTAYIDEDAVLEVAKKSGAHAVIPGYGFLSENAGFCERVEKAGLVWVGPPSRVINQFGLKHTARDLAVEAGVPVIKGSDLLSSAEEAVKAAEDIGYPIMLKATAGGGGMGLQICHSASEIAAAFQSVTDRGASLFNNTAMFMEKYVAKSRHVEVQVFGNGLGYAVHFGERECSIQRRHQKVVEECPSPFVHGREGMREKVTECAVRLASNVSYGSAGTVEFLVDDLTGEFYFLEMNTRLQVEHGITEMCYDVDLVSLMLQQAEMQARGQGGIPQEALKSIQKTGPTGFAIESRIYAEVPSRNFAPSPGLLQNVEWYQADGIRYDTWIISGTNISPYYDPMIAKVIVWDETHDKAAAKMHDALTKSKVQGCPTNIQYLAAIVESEAFKTGDTTTAFLTSSSFSFTPHTIDIISGGAYTTVQDWPARRGIGNGVPESGPMDSVSFRIANAIVGNDETTEGLEVTLIGPELLFNVAAVVAVTGGVVDVTINGSKVDMYTRLLVPAGSKVKLGMVSSGCRSYIAVKGGFPAVPAYLGSKGTTSTLNLGGYQGRQLRPNDSLDLHLETDKWAKEYTAVTVPAEYRLDKFWSKEWTLYCMPGPHDDPEFVTEDDRSILYDTQWQLSHNATRSGYRLKGPKLNWARTDGGEGGSHPANVIDEPYTYGGLNWNGDEPVILPVDGPMAGGLATTTTIVRADFWRLGQCRPGDKFQYKRITWQSAVELRRRTERYIASIAAFASSGGSLVALDVVLPDDWEETIMHEIPADDARGSVAVKFRQAGECAIQVTYGPMTANALTRAHVQNIVNRIHAGAISGVTAVNDCARAFCVEFDCLKTTQREMLDALVALEQSLAKSHEPLPSRLFKLPILLDDPISKAAVADYMATVRDSATYLPDNMAYIAKANGVDDVAAAARSIVACPQLVTEVSFLAGTPLFLPLDPRLVYVAQKYNPVRLFTPEGTVGIGGPLGVIYPMDAPGGYQLWGRSLAAWDAYASKPGFTKPWLFRTFDQIQFYEVDQAEFDRVFELFKTGRYEFDYEETTFDPVSYKQFLDSIKEETEAFVTKRNAAGKALGEEENRMLAEWRAKQAEGKDETMDDEGSGGSIEVTSPMTASVWKVLVQVGDNVKAGESVAILEAMKMEIHVRADEDGQVCKIVSKPGTLVDPGQVIMTLKA